jgi:hypothetical protein
MKNFIHTFLFLICVSVCQSAYARQEVVVVANIDYDVELSKQEIRNVFMGGTINYDLTAIELPPNNSLRILFNTKVVGLTEARIQSYWAQMRFSGRKKQPKQLQNTNSVIEYLLNNKGAIAYLPANSNIPSELTVVYSVE